MLFWHVSTFTVTWTLCQVSRWHFNPDVSPPAVLNSLVFCYTVADAFCIPPATHWIYPPWQSTERACWTNKSYICDAIKTGGVKTGRISTQRNCRAGRHAITAYTFSNFAVFVFEKANCNPTCRDSWESVDTRSEQESTGVKADGLFARRPLEETAWNDYPWGCQRFTVLNNAMVAGSRPAKPDGRMCCDTIDVTARWNDFLADAFS